VQTVRRDGYAIDTGASALGLDNHATWRWRANWASKCATAPYIAIRRAGITHLLTCDHMVRAGLKTGGVLSLGANCVFPDWLSRWRWPRRGRLDYADYARPPARHRKRPRVCDARSRLSSTATCRDRSFERC
jgi:oxygen-dependent protoporphyrinogen oxidase